MRFRRLSLDAYGPFTGTTLDLSGATGNGLHLIYGPNEANKSSALRAIRDLRMAQAIGLKVVAEGVETERQQEILRQLGCDELQGYLFAKPMSARALAHWAMNQEGPSALDFRASLFGETRAVELA